MAMGKGCFQGRITANRGTTEGEANERDEGEDFARFKSGLGKVQHTSPIGISISISISSISIGIITTA